jgi:hypothetical protein
MATVATAPTAPSAVHEKFSKGPGFIGTVIFIAVLVVGISYIGWSVSRDLANLHVTSVPPGISDCRPPVPTLSSAPSSASASPIS